MSMGNKTFSGAPEDLVLNDIFGEAFIREGIDFDKRHGLFKVVTPHCGEIQVSGNEVGVFWTRRALERLGYSVTGRKDCARSIRIELKNDEWVWRYNSRDKTEVFSSVEALICHLKPKGGKA